MNEVLRLKDYIDLDGTRYWHYTFGGKYTATKWIVVNGIHWYDTNKPKEFEPMAVRG